MTGGCDHVPDDPDGIVLQDRRWEDEAMTTNADCICDGIYLTKWPRLIVVGDPVPADLAAEIIVRTDSWWLSSNDHEWTKTVAGLAGIALDAHGLPDFDSVDAFKRRYDVLDLEYLHNLRIVSAWLGGPHGWVDWDGAVGCSTWNIGKWPDAPDVHAEWERIAAAWPQLRLRAQLCVDEGAGPPVVEWEVADGTVRCSRPSEPLSPLVELSTASMLNRLLVPGSERGCAPETLALALSLCDAKRVDDERMPETCEDCGGTGLAHNEPVDPGEGTNG